jgi:WD40 repeat protein
MGYRDIILVPEKKLFFSVTSDMNALSRVDSYLTNLQMPWDKSEEQVLLSVGVLEAWL